MRFLSRKDVLRIPISGGVAQNFTRRNAMDYKVMLAITLPMGLALAAIGSALGLGKAVAAAMDATGRQPEAANKILINLTIGCAFIEAITIYALVFAFVLAGKL